MKDLIRLVLIDPCPATREPLKRLLGGMSRIWLADTICDYQDAARHVKDLAVQAALVVLDHEPNRAVELIAALTESDPRLVVVPASTKSDGSLIIRSVRAGAREFVTLPAEPSELLDTLNRLVKPLGEDEQGKKTGPRIVSVTGASGGVGVTTIAVNLASTLATLKHHDTLLLDLDLAFGSVDAFLDIPADYTLSNIMQSFDRLDLTLLKRSMNRHGSGLYVLPRPVDLNEAAAIDPELLKRLLGLLRAAYGTVVIDTSKGLQATDFAAFEMSDLILVVVQLDLICLRNTARFLQMLRQFEGIGERARLIENRAGLFDGEISRARAEETLKMPISWQIPDAPRVLQAARTRGAPIADVAKGSRAHQLVLEAARSLWPILEEESARNKRGLFAAFF